MNKFNQKLSTPLVAFAFVCMALSGLYMHFIAKNHTLEEVHGHIGILFVVGAIFHIILNSKAMINRLKKPISYTMIIPILILTAVTIHHVGEEKKVSNRFVIQSLASNSLTNVANLFKKDPTILVQKLAENNIKVPNPEESISKISKENNIGTRELLFYFQ